MSLLSQPEAVPSAVSDRLAVSRGLWIDGRMTPAAHGRCFETRNPSTGEVLSEVADAEASDVDRAVNSADRAFRGPWSRLRPFDRQRVLLQLARLIEENYEELAVLDSLDYGGPIASTRASVRRAVSLLNYYAGAATSIRGSTTGNSLPGDFMTMTVREPMGVVAAITPWNRPLITAIWKVAPALAVGCTVVLKPSEEASLSSLRFAELAREAGVPDGVLNVVTGGPTVGQSLVEHPQVRKISFTGSTATGQAIMRAGAADMKRLSLELGGKSANIVFADADLDAAVPAAGMAVFMNTGQACFAGSRLFVQRAIYDEFVARVGEYSATLKVGNSLDPDVVLGPLVSQRQRERVTGLVGSGVAQGARLVAGGNDWDATEPGYFYSPTVFADVQDQMTIAREEIFGPVISALPFDTVDEVVSRANSLDYGLAAGVWTQNGQRGLRVANSLEAGTVWINAYGLMDPDVPFGGYKQSGSGLESGSEHIEEFLETKAIYCPA